MWTSRSDFHNLTITGTWSSCSPAKSPPTESPSRPCGRRSNWLTLTSLQRLRWRGHMKIFLNHWVSSSADPDKEGEGSGAFESDDECNSMPSSQREQVAAKKGEPRDQQGEMERAGRKDRARRDAAEERQEGNLGRDGPCSGR